MARDGTASPLRRGLHAAARSPFLGAESYALLGLGGARADGEFPMPSYDDLTGIAIPALRRMRVVRRIGLAVSLVLLVGGAIVTFVVVPASGVLLIGVAAFLLGAFLTVASGLMLRNVDRELVFAAGLARSAAPRG